MNSWRESPIWLKHHVYNGSASRSVELVIDHGSLMYVNQVLKGIDIPGIEMFLDARLS